MVICPNCQKQHQIDEIAPAIYIEDEHCEKVTCSSCKKSFEIMVHVEYHF